MTCDNLKRIVEFLGKNPVSICYGSDLEEMLSEIYIDQWTPSYESNHGKNRVRYT